MSLVRSCSVERAQAVARASLRTVEGHGFVPTAGLEFDKVSNEVALLQWDLAYLGFMDPDEVSGGGGRFGPLTQDAVTAFQESRGVPATGLYGDLTAAALVQALVAEPADVPVQNLDVEAESDEVARLQTALERLGYMDMVTGYYGSITTDAVTSFQQDNGIDATGAYGPITRMALASRLRAVLAREEVPGEVGEMAPVGFVALDVFPY
jgi:peptidoglycan hydrolase-like protein with peptidoglycan-binding domain